MLVLKLLLFTIFQISNREIYLNIFQGSFAHQEIRQNWYTDKTEIYTLEFMECDFKIISANAFDIKHIKVLIIHSLHAIEMKMGALNGLKSVQQMIFSHTISIDTTYRILEPIAQSVLKLLFSNMDSRTNMYNFIGGIALINLINLSLIRMENFKVITPHSITNTPALERLMISKCSTEVILSGSFNHFHGTLKTLILTNNQLTTLPVDFFERLGFNLKYGQVSLFPNPWLCDCTMLQLNQQVPNFSLHSTCEYVDIMRLAEVCRNWQPPLHRKRSHRCIDHYGTNSLRINYTFEYRLWMSKDREWLYIKSPYRSTFYLLVFHTANKLPTCLRINAKFTRISFHNLHLIQGIRLIAITYLESNIKVWPRNLLAYSQFTDATWIAKNEKWFYLMVFITTIVVCGIAAVGIGYIFAKWNLLLPRNRKHVSFTQNEKAIKMIAVHVSSASITANREYFNNDCVANEDTKCVIKNRFVPILKNRMHPSVHDLC